MELIELPFEIREVFPFIFLNEPMENIVAWNFWILMFQLIGGVILILYLRRIVAELQLRSVIKTVTKTISVKKIKNKKNKNHHKRSDSVAQTKQKKKVKKKDVSVTKQDKKNRKSSAKKQKQKKVRKRKDKPFSNAQEIE